MFEIIHALCTNVAHDISSLWRPLLGILIFILNTTFFVKNKNETIHNHYNYNIFASRERQNCLLTYQSVVICLPCNAHGNLRCEHGEREEEALAVRTPAW
jgi:hypothetical protein